MLRAGAIGCNLAWALIDAIMYLMGCLAERASGRQTMPQVLRAATPEQARAAIASRLPPLVASALTAADLDKLLSTLSRSSGSTPASKAREARLARRGGSICAGVGLDDPDLLHAACGFRTSRLALRVSNSIAVLMMMIAGYAFGHLVGYRPCGLTAGSMVLLGCSLRSTIALGG